jgi:peptidoglycan-N-acetylglucosamine deacetylase
VIERLPKLAARLSSRLSKYRMARRRGLAYRDFYLFPSREPGARGALPSPPLAALTFDDGPHEQDEAILMALAAAGAKATFFLVGERVAAHPEIVTRILQSGHEVATHGWRHIPMPGLSLDEQRAEIARCTRALAALGGVSRWFRPPWGEFDETTLAAAALERQHVLLWNLDSHDTLYGDAARVTAHVARRLAPGSVVCMHSYPDVTPESLPAILDRGQALGLRFVTVSEWAAGRSATATGDGFQPLRIAG